MQKETHKNKKYSVETRIQAVEAYLREEGSQREICKEFEIKDVHTPPVHRFVLCAGIFLLLR